MLTKKEEAFVKHFFQDLPTEDLVSVAVNISKHNLNPKTREDSLQIICQHSTCIEAVFQKKKVTKTYISEFLHKNNVSITASWDKNELIRMIIDHWNLKKPLPNETSSSPFTIYSQEFQSDEYYRQLAYQFSEWYYQLINDEDEEKLGPEHFFVDSQLRLVLQYEEGTDTMEANSSMDVVQALKEVKNKFKFQFLPNLAPNSVQYASGIHGQVMVLVSGTLHQNVSQVVGLFEQGFLLIRDVTDNNNWKIKKSQFLCDSNFKDKELTSIAANIVKRTTKKAKRETFEDPIQTILAKAKLVEEVLERKKVTKQHLFDFMDKNGLPFFKKIYKNARKNEIIREVLKIFGIQTSPPAKPKPLHDTSAKSSADLLQESLSEEFSKRLNINEETPDQTSEYAT